MDSVEKILFIMAGSLIAILMGMLLVAFYHSIVMGYAWMDVVRYTIIKLLGC